MSNLSTSSFKHNLTRTIGFLGLGAGLMLLVCLGQKQIIKRIYNSDTLYFGADKTVLILGDSHAACSFDPDVITNAVNVGIGDENVLCSYYKLIKILDANPQLTTVVYACDVHNIIEPAEKKFFEGRNADVQYNRYFPLFDAQGRRYALGNIRLYARSYFTFVMCFPLEWDRRTISLISPDAAIPYIGSFTSLKMQVHDKGALLVNRLRDLHYIDGNDQLTAQPAQPSLLLCEYLERICELTSYADIDLVIVSTPVMHEFQEKVPGHLQRYYESLICRLLESHKQVQYRDYRSFVWNQQELLYDSDHLNGTGAAKFSKFFLETLPD